ncbi:MAG: ParA family protein [Betaproteobacteria bacterium]|nr:ParA family protein [Betaproteobacteria bacterium]
MPIITVGSPKGGCGKTTTVLALASEIRSSGHEVCIIDADDQLSAFNWYQSWKPKDRITVLNASNLARDIEIRAHIIEAAKEHTFVIIDPAGRAAQRMQWAASLSDYWIIPQQPTALDVDATRKILEEDMEAVVGMRGGRPIPFRVLITRTNPLIDSMNVKHVIEATKQHAPIFDAQLRQYDAFPAMGLYHMTLEEIQAAKLANADRPRLFAQQILAQILEDLKAAADAKMELQA